MSGNERITVDDLRKLITEVARKNTKLGPPDPVLKERFPDWDSAEFSIDVVCKQKPLFKFENRGYRIQQTCDDSCRQGMTEIMDKSGAFDLEFVFYPNKSGLALKHDKIVRKQANVIGSPEVVGDARKSTRDSGWVSWFNEIFRLLAEEVHLIPDTNILMRHYYSNYLKGIRSIIYPNLQVLFKISRLSILEVENRYNREEKNREHKHDDKKSRRIAFHTAKEILALQQEYNSILPEVNIELLTSFSTAVGHKFSDAWIRREVISYMRYLKEDKGQEDTTKAVVFVTGDLMNALAASAEGLNTLYISRLNQMSDTLAIPDFHNAYGILARLLLCTAIHFEECDCTIRTKKGNQNFKLTGMWTGKNITDWISDSLILERTWK